jgi:hypothetical protein
MLIALSVLLQFWRTHSWRALVGIVTTAVLIVIPWLARSVMISGYLVFPFYELDLFNVDWKVPASWAQSERYHVTYLNRYRGVEVSEIMSWDFVTWVRAWYSIQPLPRLIMVWTAVGLPYLYLIHYLFHWKDRRSILAGWQPYLYAVLVIYIGMLYWFLVSPLIRFVHGNLISALALLLAAPFGCLIQRLAADPAKISRFHTLKVLRKHMAALPGAALVLLFAYHAVFLARSFETATFTSRIVLPADYIKLPSHPCQGYNMTLWCADFYGECWYDPFPCLPGLTEKIGQRGTTLEDGFYSRDLAGELSTKK